MKKPLCLLTAVALTGCATAPQNIQPQFVSETSYRAMDCQTLGRELHAIDNRLSELAAKQKQARSTDTLLVTAGTLLVWPAYFGLLATPDYSDEISRLRGEADAIMRADQVTCS